MLLKKAARIKDARHLLLSLPPKSSARKDSNGNPLPPTRLAPSVPINVSVGRLLFCASRLLTNPVNLNCALGPSTSPRRCWSTCGATRWQAKPLSHSRSLAHTGALAQFEPSARTPRGTALSPRHSVPTLRYVADRPLRCPPPPPPTHTPTANPVTISPSASRSQARTPIYPRSPSGLAPQPCPPSPANTLSTLARPRGGE
jgi:hypothetical protein